MPVLCRSTFSIVWVAVKLKSDCRRDTETTVAAAQNLAAKTTRWIKHVLLRLMFCRSLNRRFAVDIKLYPIPAQAVASLFLIPTGNSKS